MNIPTSTLRKSLGASSDIAKLWFEDRTEAKTRDIFEAKGKLGDDGSGAVYVYFNEAGEALYVGLTSRKVKARLHDQTSPHKNKPWWLQWHSIKFVQLSDDMDRQILEFLLILSYSPKFNEKPKAKNLDELLPA
ncbi:MAG: hypothetical protein ABFS08_10245 [Pseudomonadota bacterium]